MFYTIVTDVSWVYLRTLLSKREGAILVVVEGLFLSLVITEISLSKITFMFLTGGDRLSDRGPAQWRLLKFECHFEGPPVNEILSQLAERKVSVPCLSIGSHFCRNHQIRRPLKLTNIIIIYEYLACECRTLPSWVKKKKQKGKIRR